MSIAGKMSTIIRVRDNVPSTRISRAITAIVYGRRRARRTIHMRASQGGRRTLQRNIVTNTPRLGLVPRERCCREPGAGAAPAPCYPSPSTEARVAMPLVALCALTAAVATQQPDTTLWTRLRYRFVGPEGNRAVAVVGEPGNPLVAYIGAASGGIWKTEDGGVHWRAVFDSQPAQAIGALALAPSAHNVLWAGTGETFFIRSTTALGNGVYRSTDGGRSWQHQGLDATGRIARIVIHPWNPDIVLVCALGRAYGPAQDRGVYRTTDGGKTWTRVLFVDPNTGCSDLAIDPGDPNTLFAGMWQFEVKTWHLQSGGPGGGLRGVRGRRRGGEGPGGGRAPPP